MQSGQTTQADLLIEQNQFNQYQARCQSMQERIGHTGMIQHCFVSKENADALLVWLKQQTNLQALGIDKANVKQETQQDKSIAYVVRLTKEQRAAILASAPPVVIPVADPLAQLSADDKALVEVNKATGRSGLGEAAINLKEQEFIALVAKASVMAIDAALVIKDKKDWTAWHTAANYQSEAAFKELVAKASATAIDAALVIKDNEDWTAWHSAARYQSEAAFKALVAKASAAAIDEALVIQNKYGWMVWHMAARYQIEAAFKALVAKASVASIDAALVKQNKEGWTVLQMAAHYQSEQAFMALVAKASAAVIDAALVIKNKEDWMAFHSATRYLSEHAFKALVAKASVASIDAALAIQSKDGWTVLQIAARNQSEHAFKALVAKASVASIDAALAIQSKDGWTVLQTAARYQSEQAFIALVNKASPAALQQCLVLGKSNLWSMIFSDQSPLACAALLSRIDAEALPSVSGTLPPYVFKKCVSYLLHEPSWQNPAVIKNCFAMMSSKLVSELLRCWLEGQVITPALAAQIEKYIYSQERSLDSLTHLEKDWLRFENDRAKENFVAQLAGSDKCLSMEQMLQNKQHIAAWVFESGVASWKDYHLLRMAQGDTPHLKEALDRLQSAGLLFSGCKEQFFVPTATGLEHEDLLKKIAQDDILFKMIQVKDWDEFFGQIADYNTRPATLRKPDVKKQATHKFKHIDGKIEDYKAKDTSQAQTKPPHTHTKKLSTTLMARNLSTTVFGESHADRELVGILFDRSKCRLKAMLAHDSGTYLHEWIGAKSDVEDYAKRMVPINYTAIDKFIERVNKYSHRTNEILAELSREAMLAIVIARDTPNARKIARARRKEIKEKLNITLPIVFYDNVKRTLQPYTAQQILQDELGINMDKEALAKVQLMQLKEMISFKSDWLTYSLFKGFSASDSIMPRTARKILKKIRQAEQDEHAEKYSWEKTAKEVKELLKLENQFSYLWLHRHQETADFYQTAYQQVFSPTT